MAKGKAGRPFKEIPKLDFEKLCHLQCTQQEICDFLEVDHKTLTKWCKRTYGKEFSQVYMEKRAGGKIALRRAQMRLAEKSAAMAIFLGKNILGQSDYPEDNRHEDAIKEANSQIQSIADLINHPVEDIDIESLSDDLAAVEAGAEE